MGKWDLILVAINIHFYDLRTLTEVSFNWDVKKSRNIGGEVGSIPPYPTFIPPGPQKLFCHDYHNIKKKLLKKKNATQKGLSSVESCTILTTIFLFY